eukprot:TRINITY_DN23097_c0_g1_i1.p1 TRINITY_DN23097_c0_g1~~TRINITY_DN23097_c0_g1_i1.p1  ORF type:complete len:476 (+),score=130.50 TRINITY_DN23097_c0_g1_i1:60-1430(+)
MTVGDLLQHWQELGPPPAALRQAAAADDAAVDACTVRTVGCALSAALTAVEVCAVAVRDSGGRQGLSVLAALAARAEELGVQLDALEKESAALRGHAAATLAEVPQGGAPQLPDEYALIELSVASVKPRWPDLDPTCPWRELVERLWPVADYVESSGDDMFAESILSLLKRERTEGSVDRRVPSAICSHLLRILRSQRHPAGCVLRRFGQLCREEYGPQLPAVGDYLPDDAEKARVGAVCLELVADVRAVSEALHCRLCGAFPFLDGAMAERWCVYSVEQEAGRELADMTERLYAAAAADRNLLLNDALGEAREALAFSDLVLDPALLMVDGAGDPSPQPFAAAVELLQQLGDRASAVEKVALLLKVCAAIDAEVAACPSSAHLSPLDAHALVPVLTHVLLRAGIRDVASHVRMMLDFMPEELEEERAGCCLAALSSSLEVVYALSPPQELDDLGG